jgi:hypothetical protein
LITLLDISILYFYNISFETALRPNLSFLVILKKDSMWGEVYMPGVFHGNFQVDYYYYSALARYYIWPDRSPSLRGWWIESGLGLCKIEGTYPYDGDNGVYAYWQFDTGYKFEIGKYKAS